MNHHSNIIDGTQNLIKMAGANQNTAEKAAALKILHMECKLIISVANPAAAT